MTRSAIKAAQSDKEFAKLSLEIAESSPSNLTKAAAALFALQLAPWPAAEAGTLEKWRHSSRLPSALRAAREAARGLSAIGFVQGAWWFLEQADKRARLADFVPQDEVVRIQSMMIDIRNVWKYNGNEPFVNNFETSAIPDACDECNALTVNALKAELPPRLVCCSRLSRVVKHVTLLNQSQCDCVGLITACAELLALLGPMASIPAVRDYLVTQIAPRGHLPHLSLLAQLRQLQRQMDDCPDTASKCLLLLEEVTPIKVPHDPTAVYLQRDSLGKLWAMTGKSIQLVCANGRVITELVNKLNSTLKANKEDVRASKEGKDVREFWDERKLVDRDIGEIISDFGSFVFGDYKFPGEAVRLALCADLLGFPVESTPQLKGKRVTRIVPLSSGLSSGSGSVAVLNPSGDLAGTEQAMRAVLPPDCVVHAGKTSFTESALLDILGRAKLFVYAGHCGGEKLWNGTAIQRLRKITANVFLLGCRSSQPYASPLAPFCTPFHYLIGGSCGVTGVLWDVLGRDCDRVSSALVADFVKHGDLSAALAEAREACKLKHLTSAAFVVYAPLIELYRAFRLFLLLDDTS